MAEKKKGCNGFGTYIAYCDCLLENITELNTLLTALIASYRLLVGSAEEFNRITLAHKRDLEDAIDRADDLGDIIDKVICRMDRLISIYLDVCFQEILCPELIPKSVGNKVSLEEGTEMGIQQSSEEVPQETIVLD